MQIYDYLTKETNFHPVLNEREMFANRPKLSFSSLIYYMQGRDSRVNSGRTFSIALLPGVMISVLASADRQLLRAYLKVCVMIRGKKS